MNEQLQAIDQIKRTGIELGMKFGPKVLAALAILAVGYFVARWVGGGFQRWIGRVGLEPPVRLLMTRMVRLAVFAVFLLMALQNLGIELLPLIAGLGVAGAGLALAMQGVLGNLVAGLTIIFTKPFRVGEYVSMLGVEGKVDTIELFSTTLGHPDLSRIVVPNRKIVGEILHNYGQIRQLDLAVGVAYGSDLNQVLAAVRDVLANNPRVVKDPAPVVGVSMLANSSVNVSVKPWVKVPDYGPAGAEIYQAVVERFRADGINIPFPQHEVRLLNPAAA